MILYFYLTRIFNDSPLLLSRPTCPRRVSVEERSSRRKLENVSDPFRQGTRQEEEVQEPPPQVQSQADSTAGKTPSDVITCQMIDDKIVILNLAKGSRPCFTKLATFWSQCYDNLIFRSRLQECTF